MKIGYVIGVESLINEWPFKYILIDYKTRCVVKMFDSIDELNIYADLHGYEVKDLSEVFPFKK